VTPKVLGPMSDSSGVVREVQGLDGPLYLGPRTMKALSLGLHPESTSMT
jgi:hypothetical protein